MIPSLKDSVFHKPTLEKKADYELPQDVSEWNEEILKQFYSDVDYLPKNVKVDVAVNSVDDNKGYAKGSIVVFYGGKKINFPIIVKDYKLSPFDVFIHKDNGVTKYHSSNLDSLKTILNSDQLGTLENYWGKGGPIPGVKSTGGVFPKQAVNIWDQAPDRLYPSFSKMSSWPFLAKKEDLEKLAVQMKAHPDVADSFIENSGDVISNIIDLKDNKKRVIGDDHVEGILDLNNVVKAKQTITAIDSEFIDVESLVPVRAPSVCELRLYEFPTMEDFIESGDGMAERFKATKVGKPVSGIVLDYKTESDLNCKNTNEPTVESSGSDDNDPKEIRNKRPQIFISLCGCYYSTFNDWNKTGIGFYGSKTLNTAGAAEKAIAMISDNTSDEFINQNHDNKRDGSDKLFAAIGEMNQGLDENTREYSTRDNYNAKMFVIYGAGDAWESVKFRGNYRKYNVNNTRVYVSADGIAIIPANVASIQKVSSVEDPVYKMVIGKAENIYLIPEGSLIINAEYMKKLDFDDIMSPGKPIRKKYEEAAIKKVAVYIAPIDDENLGYKIDGAPFEPLKKIAGVNGAMKVNEALCALQIMGMEKQASKDALAVALNRYADIDTADKSVVVYGVRDDYINEGVFDEQEKTAGFSDMIKEYAYSLRKDLVKEASALDDPEAVDVVLSLNFINEDSLAGYIKNLEEMKRIQSNMVEMLIASRMGLSDLNEGALEKSIDGLQEVIKGLEELKLATSAKKE